MTDEEIRSRFEQGSAQFDEIRRALSSINAKLEPIPRMQEDISATKEVVDAWAAMKTGGRFLKWLAGVLTSAALIWASVKVGITGLFK